MPGIVPEGEMARGLKTHCLATWQRAHINPVKWLSVLPSHDEANEIIWRVINDVTNEYSCGVSCCEEQQLLWRFKYFTSSHAVPIFLDECRRVSGPHRFQVFSLQLVRTLQAYRVALVKIFAADTGRLQRTTSCANCRAVIENVTGFAR